MQILFSKDWNCIAWGWKNPSNVWCIKFRSKHSSNTLVFTTKFNASEVKCRMKSMKNPRVIPLKSSHLKFFFAAQFKTAHLKICTAQKYPWYLIMVINIYSVKSFNNKPLAAWLESLSKNRGSPSSGLIKISIPPLSHFGRIPSTASNVLLSI